MAEINERTDEDIRMLRNPIARRTFVVAVEAVDDIIKRNVGGCLYQHAASRLPEEVFEHVFKPVFKPLMKTIEDYQEALQKQIQYGTVITLTTEQMDKLQKDYETK